MNDTPTRVGLYGIGHFGYALLRLLERKVDAQIELRGFDRDSEVRAMLRNERRHPIYDAERPLHEAVTIVDSVADLMRDLDVLILSVTSVSTREVMRNVIAVPWTRPLAIVNTAKALDSKTGRRLSEVVAETIGDTARTPTYMALAGGTIANELLRQNPLGLTLASTDPCTLSRIKPLLASPTMWVQTTTDLTGVEYAGAFKNVIAICAGMVRGLELSYGTETHLISRMAEEVASFCVRRMGASPETFSIGSQCWGSDLWMSCTGSTRNRALGELLGQGLSLEQANANMARQHKTVEGVQTLRALLPLFRQYPEDLRLLCVADQIVLNDEPPQLLIDELMQDE